MLSSLSLISYLGGREPGTPAERLWSFERIECEPRCAVGGIVDLPFLRRPSVAWLVWNPLGVRKRSNHFYVGCGIRPKWQNSKGHRCYEEDKFRSAQKALSQVLDRRADMRALSVSPVNSQSTDVPNSRLIAKRTAAPGSFLRAPVLTDSSGATWIRRANSVCVISQPRSSRILQLIKPLALPLR